MFTVFGVYDMNGNLEKLFGTFAKAEDYITENQDFVSLSPYPEPMTVW